jgi:hypothetical protein
MLVAVPEILPKTGKLKLMAGKIESVINERKMGIASQWQ